MTTSIIVITWDPKNKKYLDLCIESIRNLDSQDFEVILVARNGYMPSYNGVMTIAPPEDQFYPARAINVGMEFANPKSKYFFVLNDDVILTHESLKHMIEMVGDQKIMANGIATCDNNWSRYSLVFGYWQDGVMIPLMKPQFEYEELAPIAKQLMNGSSLYGQGFIRQDFLCIYATLIPRSLYEAVGDWDENFKIGQDDLDYSIRAQRAGYQCVSITNALIWHFGGKTCNDSLNLKMRQDNVRYFRSKHGHLPPGLDESFLLRSE